MLNLLRWYTAVLFHEINHLLCNKAQRSSSHDLLYLFRREEQPIMTTAAAAMLEWLLAAQPSANVDDEACADTAALFMLPMLHALCSVAHVQSSMS